MTFLPNGTLASAAFRFPSLSAMNNPSATLADLDGDSFVDLVWTGLLTPNITVFPFRNIGGNFSAVANSIAGVAYGSLAVAEFTGDAKVDIVVSGRLANGSGLATLYAQNGFWSFVRRSDIIFSNFSPYSVAAVPLRSQSSALDLVLTANTNQLQHASPIYVYQNNGNGSFSNATAPWLPSAFIGIVARGPDIGASPSFLAFGATAAVDLIGSATMTVVRWSDISTVSFRSRSVAFRCIMAK